MLILTGKRFQTHWLMLYQLRLINHRFTTLANRQCLHQVAQEEMFMLLQQCMFNQWCLFNQCNQLDNRKSQFIIQVHFQLQSNTTQVTQQGTEMKSNQTHNRPVEA